MNKKGFTLVEVVATLVIIGIISTIAVTSYSKYIENAKAAKCKADERAILDAAEAFVGNCTVKNRCETGATLSSYIGDSPLNFLTIDDLIAHKFLSNDYNTGENSDYAGNVAVKIKTVYKKQVIVGGVVEYEETSNFAEDADGITDYSFEILTQAPLTFEQLCK